MRIERYQNTRYWAVYASDGALICVCVYRKGAQSGEAFDQPRASTHQSTHGHRVRRRLLPPVALQNRL
jgi:hypothetical protein